MGTSDPGRNKKKEKAYEAGGYNKLRQQINREPLAKIGSDLNAKLLSLYLDAQIKFVVVNTPRIIVRITTHPSPEASRCGFNKQHRKRTKPSFVSREGGGGRVPHRERRFSSLFFLPEYPGGFLFLMHALIIIMCVLVHDDDTAGLFSDFFVSSKFTTISTIVLCSVFSNFAVLIDPLN